MIAKPDQPETALKNRRPSPAMNAHRPKINQRQDRGPHRSGYRASPCGGRTHPARVLPCCRKMFSCTPTASSSPMTMAGSGRVVMLFRVKPMMCMNTNSGMIDVGIAIVAMTFVAIAEKRRM